MDWFVIDHGVLDAARLLASAILLPAAAFLTFVGYFYLRSRKDPYIRLSGILILFLIDLVAVQLFLSSLIPYINDIDYEYFTIATGFATRLILGVVVTLLVVNSFHIMRGQRYAQETQEYDRRRAHELSGVSERPEDRD